MNVHVLFKDTSQEQNVGFNESKRWCWRSVPKVWN
jgi:hypothetical protein